MPSADKIAGIAKYLGVSSDYLLGNLDFESEEDFLAGLRQALYGSNTQKLSEYDKKHIIELAEMLVRMKKDKDMG
jgi:transcriptional regulator with XRE-family HTH domain